MPHLSKAVGVRAAPPLLACLVLALPACSGPVRVAESRPYPYDAPRGEVADVQVFRDVTRLKMTNTTARSFGPGTLWVNQRFSHPVDGFDVGQSLDLDLRTFVDEFATPFRAGGFFATDAPDAVVLVQLQTGDELVGFVVVRDDIE